MKDSKFVEEVASYIKEKAEKEYGFVGIAEGENMTMLNTGKGNIVINIKWE